MPYATHGLECRTWKWPSVCADLAKGSSSQHFSIAKKLEINANDSGMVKFWCTHRRYRLQLLSVLR